MRIGPEGWGNFRGESHTAEKQTEKNARSAQKYNMTVCTDHSQSDFSLSKMQMFHTVSASPSLSLVCILSCLYLHFCHKYINIYTMYTLWFCRFILYTRHLLHVCLSWERDPSSVALPKASSTFGTNQSRRSIWRSVNHCSCTRCRQLSSPTHALTQSTSVSSVSALA